VVGAEISRSGPAFDLSNSAVFYFHS